MIQFEKTRIHFKSDFFAAVAVVDAKAPYYREYLRVLEALGEINVINAYKYVSLQHEP